MNDSVRAFMAEELFYRWTDSTVAIAPDLETADLIRSEYSDVIVVDPEALERRMRLLFDEQSILWFRGYVGEDTFAEELDRTLGNYGAQLHVVAHTPVRSIESRYGGKLLAVDLLDPATEMLLLVREPGGAAYERWRFGLEGPPEPL